MEAIPQWVRAVLETKWSLLCRDLLSLFCFVVDVSLSLWQWRCNIRPIACPRTWGQTKYVVTNLRRSLSAPPPVCCKGYCRTMLHVFLLRYHSVHLFSNRKIISLISFSSSLLCFHECRPQLLLLCLKPRRRDQLNHAHNLEICPVIWNWFNLIHHVNKQTRQTWLPSPR